VGSSPPGHRLSTDGIKVVVYGFVTPALMAHVRFSLRSVISRAWREVRRCLASAWLKFPAFGSSPVRLCDSVRSDSRGQNSFPIRPDCASEPRKRVFTCNDEDADPSHGIVRLSSLSALPRKQVAIAMSSAFACRKGR
jgi:hypothetical protein